MSQQDNTAVMQSPLISGRNSTNRSKSKLGAVLQLFRYATALDWVFMLVGAVMAIIHGTALPIAMVVFGELTNAFVNQYTSLQLANFEFYFDPADFIGGDRFAIISPSILLSGFINFTNITGGVVNCSEDFVLIEPNLNFDDVLQLGVTDLAECLENDEFIALVNYYVTLFGIIAAVVFVTSFFQILLFQSSCEKQVSRIRLKFYHSILKQEIGWFDATPSGGLSSRLSDDVNKIHAGIGDTLAILIQWITTFIAGFVVGFIVEWRLTLLLLPVAPFLAASGAIFSVVTSAFVSEEQKQYASAGAIADEVLSSIRTVIAYGGEYKELERYNHHLERARQTGGLKGFIIGTHLGIGYFLVFISYALAFWGGAYLISEEIIQAGEVLTVFFAVLVGAYSIGQATPHVEKFLTAAGAAVAIYDITHRQPLVHSSPTKGDVPDTFKNDIEFRDIYFSYPTRTDVQVMNGFNMKVNAGQTVALVGPSGCGKTTAVNLLLRLYDIIGGEILIGGRDIHTLNLKWLRNHLGLVSQKPVLFDTTIAENIRYGKEGATMEEIEDAARKANAHDFIVLLPDGYDTVVGEYDTQLSTGQKQRIAIARALVRDPKILLLDEATSSLDSESEAVVQAALDKARLGRTTIMIAHRLSTVQNADLIVAMENGQVVEMGTHSQLLENGGLYYDMITAQVYRSEEPPLYTATDTLPSEIQPSELPPKVEFQQEVYDAEQMQHEEEPNVSWRKILQLNSREWWIIGLGITGAAVQGAIFPVFAIFFAEVLLAFTYPYDEVVERVNLWAGLSILVGGISGIATFLKMVSFSVSGENMTCRLRYLAFGAILRQEMAWFDDEKHSTRTLNARLASDASQVQGATGFQLGILVEAFAGIVTAIIIAFIGQWLLTLVVLGFVPILILAGLLQLKALRTDKKGTDNATKLAVESIDNIQTVAAFSAEETFFRMYQHEIGKPHRRVMVNTLIYGLSYSFAHGIVLLAYAVTFRFGAFLLTRPVDDFLYASIDEVYLVFLALVFGALGIGQAASFAPNYTKAKASAKRIYALLDRRPVMDNFSEDGLVPDTPRGEITMRDVHFSYPNRPTVKVLDGLSISVLPGQTLAIVGASGCGKSTVMSLIERFYDPQSGNIVLDDTDIRALNIRWLRSQIGVVFQEPALLDRSITDNIRYGVNFGDVSDDDVIGAARAANIHDFITSLPMGYNTSVGEKGVQLSGGQKQRIAIARALLRNPRMLLLDDATSALDTESEKVVQEALDHARQGRTSIVIAHRVSSVYNADAIAVLQEGKVVELGSHPELMARRGVYYKLSSHQMLDPPKT